MISKKNCKKLNKRGIFQFNTEIFEPVVFKKTRAKNWKSVCHCGKKIQVKIFQHKVPSSICTHAQIMTGCEHLERMINLSQIPVAILRDDLGRVVFTTLTSIKKH